MAVDIPAGFVLRKAGGRPKSTAKHLAVFMARCHFEATFGKRYMADDELMKLWSISDSSVIRRMVVKATETAKHGVTMSHPDGWVLWAKGGFNRLSGVPSIQEGAELWFWTKGLKQAIPLRAVNVQTSFDWQASGTLPHWGPAIKVNKGGADI
jgi:hypothetical protein